MRLLAWLVNTLEEASIAPVYNLDAAQSSRIRRTHLASDSAEAQVISFRPVSRLLAES